MVVRVPFAVPSKLVGYADQAREATSSADRPMNATVSQAQPFRELADALRTRIAVIQDRAAYERDPAAHLEQLKAASEAIESRAGNLPRPVDPNLAHYLSRCSYDKALAWIEDELTRASSNM